LAIGLQVIVPIVGAVLVTVTFVVRFSSAAITVEDIETARRLFADVKQSVKYVQEQEKAFMLDYSVERSD